MTVKELIEILVTYPMESDIVVFTENGDEMLEDVQSNIDNDVVVLYYE